MSVNQHKSILYILITAFCFGTMEIALKIGGGDFTALQMTFLRFVIGGLFLLPFALHDLKKRRVHLTPGDFAWLVLLGIVGVCISMTAFQIGVMQANANTASVIISTNPVFTMIFSYFIVGEPFTVRKAVVLLLSVTGLIIVANPLHMAEGNTLRGILVSGGGSRHVRSFYGSWKAQNREDRRYCAEQLQLPYRIRHRADSASRHG